MGHKYGRSAGVSRGLETSRNSAFAMQSVVIEQASMARTNGSVSLLATGRNFGQDAPCASFRGS